MNTLLTVALFSSVNLYFLKDSPNLLARITPEVQTDVITFYYSFSREDWNSRTMQSSDGYFDAVMVPPESLNVVGIYYTYEYNTMVRADDNKGMFYLFEVRKSPKMLMPFTMDDLDVILKQARKKITSQKHIDEAIALLDYVAGMLRVLPFKKDSSLDIRKKILESEVSDLRKLLP